MINPATYYIHCLKQLKRLLNKINQSDKVNLLNDRLYSNMLDLQQQARTAIGFTLRSCCPLAGREIVNFSDNHYGITSLLVEIDLNIDYLADIPPEQYSFEAYGPIETVAGFADLEFSPTDYFLMYTFPNFLFHYSMVYAIARKSGLEIGKEDFDGFHKYPLGFNFTDTE
jgi:uncharacterized protein